MRDLIETMRAEVAGAPLWLWLLAGIGIGAALFGYGSPGDGCGAFAARC